MKYFRISLLVALVFVSSCKYTVDYKTVSEESQLWFPSQDYNKGFVMVDNNGFTKRYKFENETTSSQYGSSGNILFQTSEYEHVSIVYSYSSNFNITLSPGFDGFGEYISVTLGRFWFKYDFKHETLSYVSIGDKWISERENEKSYSSKRDIKSTVNIINEYQIGDIKYKDVLHFKLDDFKDSWAFETVTELYYAKGIGLVKYGLAGGVVYTRE